MVSNFESYIVFFHFDKYFWKIDKGVYGLVLVMDHSEFYFP